MNSAVTDTVAAEKISIKTKISAALAREPHEVERATFEFEIVNVTILTLGVVDLPISVRPAEVAPSDEAHVMQTVCNDGRIFTGIVMAGACWDCHGEAKGGHGRCKPYDTRDVNHRICLLLGVLNLGGNR
jgi:hypothetical protein